MKKMMIFVLMSIIFGLGNAVAQETPAYEGEISTQIHSVTNMKSQVLTKNILAKMILKKVMKKVEKNGSGFNGTYTATTIFKGYNKFKTLTPYNNSVTIVVKDGDKSDAVPSYVSQQAMLMTLGFVDFSKCTVRHIRFMASEDSKVVCRYKTVVNGKSVTSVSEGSCHQPFAFVMAREQASGSLVLPSTINATSSQVSSADQLERLLSRWAATEGESSIQL
jgi:hypothetical protein